MIKGCRSLVVKYADKYSNSPVISCNAVHYRGKYVSLFGPLVAGKVLGICGKVFQKKKKISKILVIISFVIKKPVALSSVRL